MKKLKYILYIAVSGLILPLLCGFRLPPDSAKELIPVETIQSQVSGFKWITIIALIILAISVTANIILILYMLRQQNQISDALLTIKNYNANRDAVNQIAEKVRVYTNQEKKDDIEVIRKQKLD
ncbi:MAG: hypothetical protein ABIH00_04840 [Armatimonadota bacterium]